MKRISITLTALATALAVAIPVSAADRPEPERLSGSARIEPVDLDQVVRLFVQLDEPSVAEYVADSSSTPSKGQQQAQANRVEAQQDSVEGEIEAAGADIVDNLVVGANGFHVDARIRDIPGLAGVGGVASVSRVARFTPSNESSVPWIGADAFWDAGFTGEGVTIGVIDTGIDYLHANFGGSGDPADYAANDPAIIEDGTFPTAKVVGGYDFAGNDYDADGDVGEPTPVPDDDPLDCHGHGSHVSGTAAGLGVPGEIGPGVAPAASLYALKVFGCDGSTDVTSQAIEWALDPNGDGSMDDHLDVINMSLGSPFGSADDPTTISTNNAVRAGVVVVASAGNEGPAPYVTGSPAVADKAISVAASVDGGISVLGIDVVINGTSTQFEATEGALGPALDNEGVTGAVAIAEPYLACDPLTNGSAIDGKIALIARGTCNFSVKYLNAQAAGAIAIIVVNNVAGAPIVMGGDGTGIIIPGVMVSDVDGATINAAVPSGVTATLSTAIVIPKPELADTLASFTSRGPGFGDTFKPDVAAPGFSIKSTAVGTGDKGSLSSGTSMASPHVAGLAALLLDQRPDLSPKAVKAIIMNSTRPAAERYPLALQGVGVVQGDVAMELDSYANPGGVSFGRVDRVFPTIEVREIQITNMTGKAQVYKLSHEPLHQLDGVTVKVQSSLLVRSGRTGTARVLMYTQPSKMASDDAFFSQSEVDGWVKISGGGDELRVGYMAAVDPATDINISRWRKTLLASNITKSEGPAEGFAHLGGGLMADDEPYSIAALGVRENELIGYPVIEFGLSTDKSWNTFSPYEMDIYIDDDPTLSCHLFGDPDLPVVPWESIAVIADLGLLQGGDPTGTLATAVLFQCDHPIYDIAAGDFLLDWEAQFDYNDQSGLFAFDADWIAPQGDGKFEFEAYSFDYYSDNFDGMSGDVDFDALPSADPQSFILGRGREVIQTSGKGSLLWLFQNNRRGDQAQVVKTP